MPPVSDISPQLRKEIEDALDPVQREKEKPDPFAGFCPISRNGQHCHRRPVKSVSVICLSCGLRRTAKVCLRHWWQMRRHQVGHNDPDIRADCPPGGPWHITKGTGT